MKLLKELIIYKALNLVNNKSYIGYSLYGLQPRKTKHIKSLNKGSTYLFHNALRKYGTDNFSWEIIDRADNSEDLKLKEIYWIKFLNTKMPNGYNMTDGGEGVIGYAFTEKDKLKISLALKGKPSWRKGQTYDELYDANKSLQLKEILGQKSKNYVHKPHTLLAKSNISKAKTGKKITPFTEEHKNNLSIANIGKHDHKGNKNPMFGNKTHIGKIWINNGINEKFIKREDFYLYENYILGRKKKNL